MLSEAIFKGFRDMPACSGRPFCPRYAKDIWHGWHAYISCSDAANHTFQVTVSALYAGCRR